MHVVLSTVKVNCMYLMSDTGNDDGLVAIFIENLWLLKHINQILQQQLVVDGNQKICPCVVSCHVKNVYGKHNNSTAGRSSMKRLLRMKGTSDVLTDVLACISVVAQHVSSNITPLLTR